MTVSTVNLALRGLVAVASRPTPFGGAVGFRRAMTVEQPSGSSRLDPLEAANR
jgi:hypothetical protein